MESLGEVCILIEFHETANVNQSADHPACVQNYTVYRAFTRRGVEDPAHTLTVLTVLPAGLPWSTRLVSCRVKTNGHDTRFGHLRTTSFTRRSRNSCSQQDALPSTHAGSSHRSHGLQPPNYNRTSRNDSSVLDVGSCRPAVHDRRHHHAASM